MCNPNRLHPLFGETTAEMPDRTASEISSNLLVAQIAIEQVALRVSGFSLEFDVAVNISNRLPQLLRCDSSVPHKWIKVKLVAHARTAAESAHHPSIEPFRRIETPPANR
jgi:hypothetical protein